MKCSLLNLMISMLRFMNYTVLSLLIIVPTYMYSIIIADLRAQVYELYYHCCLACPGV